MLSNNKNIKRLNKNFRNKNKSTDILSFPLKKKKNRYNQNYLGDIIINLGKVKCKNDKKIFLKELKKLWIHGFVHLFGYKHKKNKDFKNMLKVEKKYLKLIN